jgi:hypothetical protein
MDTKLTVHVCTEMVVIFGVAFWLNSKIGSLNAQIEEQQKIIKALEGMVLNHENFLRQIAGASPLRNPSQQQDNNLASPQTVGQTPTKNMTPLAKDTPLAENTTPLTKKRKPRQKSIKRSDIDEMLSDELRDFKVSNKEGSAAILEFDDEVDTTILESKKKSVA